MRRAFITVTVLSVSFGVSNPASADRVVRNFGELALGIAWPDHDDFSDAYRLGFCGSLGYGTRLGRDSDFFAYGAFGYDQFRARDKALNDDTYVVTFNANARYYFGGVGKYESGYIGLGPGVYWDEKGDAYFGGNVAVGGDFPLGKDWSITVNVDQHFIDAEGMAAFLTARVGAAYWFL